MTANPDPVDVHVGSRVRLRRTLLGMSQEKLGDALNLTFQQVQKYERGTNRIGSSRLYRLSRILQVPVSYFFEGLTNGQPAPGEADAGAAGLPVPDELSRRETLELVRAYYRIPKETTRRRVFELVKAVSELDEQK